MRFLRLLLLPLCPLWAFITQLRTELYVGGFIKRYIPSLPTFVVGNLSTGGTGKSPHTEYIARILSEKYDTAILSRGYGRKSKGFRMVTPSSSATECGDEPLMLSRSLLHVKTAVCENRADGIKRLLAENPSLDAVVMDDAYQHLGVKAGCYFLLTMYERPFFADYVLPAGDLRELRMNASRCHCVIVTKTPQRYLRDTAEGEEKRNMYKRYISRYTKSPVLFSSFDYSDTIHSVQGDVIRMEDLKGYNVLLITGIAHPKPLLRHLDGCGIKYTHMQFEDHHSFSDEELEKIKNDFLNLPAGNNIILTTEKDMVRLHTGGMKDMPVYSLPISVKMNEKDRHTLLSILEEHMKTDKKES